MTNTSRLEVSPPEMRRLAAAWHGQEDDLLSAAALLGQGGGALPTSVLDGVHDFFNAWSAEIRVRGLESRSIASALDAVAESSRRVDETWGNTEHWPWAG